MSTSRWPHDRRDAEQKTHSNVPPTIPSPASPRTARTSTSGDIMKKNPRLAQERHLLLFSAHTSLSDLFLSHCRHYIPPHSLSACRPLNPPHPPPPYTHHPLSLLLLYPTSLACSIVSITMRRYGSLSSFSPSTMRLITSDTPTLLAISTVVSTTCFVRKQPKATFSFIIIKNQPNSTKRTRNFCCSSFRLCATKQVERPKQYFFHIFYLIMQLSVPHQILNPTQRSKAFHVLYFFFFFCHKSTARETHDSVLWREPSRTYFI